MGRVAAPGWSDDGDDVCVSKVHGHRGTSYPRDTPASLLSPRFADSKRCDVYKHEVSYVDNLMTSLQLVVLNCEQCALQNTKRNPHMPEKVGAHQGDLARTLVSDASAITRSYSSLQKCAEVELEKVKRERADKFSVISQNVKRLEIQIKAAAPPPKPAAVVTTPEVKPAVAEEPPSPPRTPPATPLASSPAPSIPPTTVTSLAPKIVPEKPQELARPASPELYIVTAKGRMENLTTLEASIVPFADNQDPNVKRIRVLLKKKLGEACNQIANSLSSIRLVVDKIRHAFGEAKAAGEIYFNFALNFVASKMAAQVRVLAEVSSCFPIANVVAMCCVHTPELTDIFLAHMHTICPYTIPLVPVRTEGQTDDEYRVSIGMERDEAKGTFEAFEKYTQRMAMAVALVMAVMQTHPYDRQPQSTHLTIADAWRWMARVVNSAPHAMTAPVLLSAFEVAGFELHRQYKSQFLKLASVVESAVVPILSRDVKSGGAATLARLTTILTQRGFQIEPEGRNPTESKVTEADEEKTANDDVSPGYGSSRYSNNYSGGGGRGRGRGRGSYR